MIKFILIFSFFWITNFLFCQSYAYSFKGSLPVEEQNALLKKIKNNPVISSCELKYKMDSERGEIIFYIDQSELEKSELEFTPIDVKNLFIEFHLEPLDFRKIK